MSGQELLGQHYLLVSAAATGGIRRHVLDLAREFSDQGASVIVAGPEHYREAMEAIPRARWHRLDIHARPGPKRDTQAIWQLRRLSAGADLVHAHGTRAGAAAAVALQRVRQRPPLVVTLHNAAPGGGVNAALHRLLLTIAMRGCDRAAAVSADLAAEATAHGARSVENAVIAAPRARPSQPRESTRANWGLSDSDRVAISVGRLAPQKGFDLLVDAIAATPASAARSWQLWIVGEGPGRAALEQRIRAANLPVAVRLLGHRDDVADLTYAADLAISSARWEGQPVWIQEALALGVPVLATDTGGTAQVTGDGALLVAPGDVCALAEALEALMGDPDRLARWQQAAQQRGEILPTSADARQAALATYQRARARPGDHDVD